jgi:hypothetical protein
MPLRESVHCRDKLQSHPQTGRIRKRLPTANCYLHDAGGRYTRQEFPHLLNKQTKFTDIPERTFCIHFQGRRILVARSSETSENFTRLSVISGFRRRWDLRSSGILRSVEW